MKARNFLTIFAVALLFFTNVSCLHANGIDALEKEANKVVGGKFPISQKDDEDGSPSLGYFGQQGVGFQFTVSSDQDPGIPSEEEFVYHGLKTFFFRPLGDSSGGIMVLLSPEKSLVLIYNLGMFSDNEVTKKMMIGFMDKMDLEALK